MTIDRNNLNHQVLNHKTGTRLMAVWLAATMAALSGFMPGQDAFAIGSRAQTPRVENFSDQGPLVDSMVDGHQIIESMHKSASQLNDYSLKFEMLVFKKRSTVNESGNLYFKKPQLLRLEETGDYQNGSVAVISKDGKAHGHLGGMARFIKLTMAPDDKQLRAANGDSMKDSDLASLAMLLKNMLKQGVQSRVSEKPVLAKGVSQTAYVLEMYRPGNADKVLKRIFVDPNSYLPVRWDDYDFKDPSASVWKDVKTNIGLKDDLFSM